MRTALNPVADDVSARARIVYSALACFAEHGYADATVREIAAGAGVSPALVTHHFGGKAALRAECDARVERFLLDKRSERLSPTAILQESVETFGPYLATMLDAQTDAAASLFERLHALAREAVSEGVAAGRMRISADPDAQAAALVVLGVAPFLLRRRLAEWAGDEDGIRRIAVPLAEIYTHGLMTEDSLLDAAHMTEGARS
jgi:AcrR family transcriptional regulator